MRVVRPVMLLVLVAAACGRGAAPSSVGGGAPASSSPRARGEAAATKRVDPRKGGFDLGFGEFAISMEAKAIRPGQVTFVIHNGGELTHGFEIKSESDGGSNSGPGGGDDDDEYEIESASFGSGKTIRVTANLPTGLYEIECFLANHDDLGMRAFLQVRANAPLVKPKAAADNEVLVEGFDFKPGKLEVIGGTKVVWTNEDPEQHTVTAENGAFSSEALGSGDTFSFTFESAGEVAYFCAIHPSMKGTVRITG